MVDVIIYTRPGCPYCARAKALLARKGAEFNEIDASATPELRAEMQERSGRNTFPLDFYRLGSCRRLRRSLCTGRRGQAR
ncbi:glutaredoxin [Brucella suis bv. 3 str. 686]|nr:glutaredoxin [Brucella suis bv. 3 str. 686]